MNRTPSTLRTGLAALSVFFVVGCNASSVTGNDDGENGNEVRVTVQAIGSDYLDADDGIRYEVTANTKYEGLAGLADVSVGAVIEIEFEQIPDSANRRALEIEAEGADRN